MVTQNIIKQFKKGNPSLKEIWNVMPKRLQGMMFALVVALPVQVLTTIIEVFNFNVLGRFIISILAVAYLVYIVLSYSDWLGEE